MRVLVLVVRFPALLQSGTRNAWHLQTRLSLLEDSTFIASLNVFDARSSEPKRQTRSLGEGGGGNERIKNREAPMALETGPRFKILRHEVVQPSRVSTLDPKLVSELRPVPAWPGSAKNGECSEQCVRWCITTLESPKASVHKGRQ
jgi:hypothetical protein